MPYQVALIEFFGVGGTGDYTACLASAMADRGDSVLVVTSTNFQPLEVRPSYQVATVFHYSPQQPKVLKAFGLAGALRPAYKVLQQFQPDVIHVQGTVMPLMERLLYQRMDSVPRLCTVHDVTAHEWRPWLGSFPHFYRSFDWLICHSHSSLAALRSQGVDTPASTIPHGRYAPLAGSLPNRASIRAQLGLPPKAKVVLLFGFIRKYKGLDLLLEALQVARGHGQPLMALVAGRPLYDLGTSLARAQRDELPIVWKLGYIPRSEIGQYFSAADVVVFPYTETSDSGALELAAAYGKPVVVTATGGLVEAFARYGFGAVVPPNNASELARALVVPYSPPPEEQHIHSWQAVAAQTHEVYDRLLASWRPKPIAGRGEQKPSRSGFF